MIRSYHVFTLYTVFYTILSDCPPDAEQRIQLCIKSSLPNFGLGPPNDASPPSAIKTSIQMSKESCQSRKLEDSALCMQKFLDQCRGTTDREQLLQRLFNKEKIMDTVKYFCASLPVYEQHAICISEQHQQVLNCSRYEHERYVTIMRGRPTYDVLIQANCRFNKVATGCLLDFVYLNCGIEAADFIETLTMGQMPPSCEPKQKKYIYTASGNSGNQLNFSVWITMCLLTFYIVVK